MQLVSEQVKAFYRARTETNWVKRYGSPYLLRRYFSRTMWEVIGREVGDCSFVLDAGCGDGVLSVLMAIWHPQQTVLAMDISEEGVRRTREAALAHGVADRMLFVVGDAEHLPFADETFPGLVSSQVLEHLSDFDLGVKEIRRVLRGNGIGVIAIPACLNPSAMVLLGRDNYWRVGRRTPLALYRGLTKVMWAWVRGEEGVQEGYAGHFELPHIRRFPRGAVQRVTQNGVSVTHWMADSLLVPYFAHMIPALIGLQRWVDGQLRRRLFWRNFGVGVVMVVRRVQ